ncbi:cysteine hydrolase family protein [Fructilactobacillus fructivorans]|uniref:Isochorismatase family protein n=1 Tax=Fructilactobacillus fructivorans TaxID=1614 RepID=A0AAE6NZI7_9LACO|nr:isochorismatase family cysteine hydrolase [Fructilactobacillus fructivorans]KRK57181.1 pyrazinamidase-nicotinamidase [Fructilactobacillus fructivorans]KRN12106.1 pyrazinamidase-nicotinamidase [Fructilactobacillus fructivorans]QFX92331.1 isochorismatase family protein [Fructilactobacillus fructivorans]RDV64883.1 cysteine hydrolase [Fructilactobacillus fructivorans]
MADKDALLIIDYTNDFVDDQGSLTAGKPAQKLDQSIVDLAEKFKDDNQFVIFPTDVHKKDDPYSPETKLYPTHNVRGTWGRQLYGNVGKWFDKNQDLDNVWQMDKTRYSAFAGTDLDLRLRERNVKTLHLAGVCTDICVLHTAIAGYNLDYNLVIHQSGVATFSDLGQKFAMDHFKNVLGAKIVD